MRSWRRERRSIVLFLTKASMLMLRNRHLNELEPLRIWILLNLLPLGSEGLQGLQNLPGLTFQNSNWVKHKFRAYQAFQSRKWYQWNAPIVNPFSINHRNWLPLVSVFTVCTSRRGNERRKVYFSWNWWHSMFPTSKPLLRKLSQICLFSPLLVNRFDAEFSKLGNDSQSVRSISFFKRVCELLFHWSLSLSIKVVSMRNKVLSKAYQLNTILVSGISRQSQR